MTGIAFLLNGTPVRITDQPPTRTLLDWLREARGLTATKEGCNEGDCGACTVMVSDAIGPRAMNACILFLPQLHGKSVRTVEGIGTPAAPHPVQAAMVEHHASQCGFCTPGIVASLAAAHAAGRTDHEIALAGNLCRCTGYAPILRAAQASAATALPAWLETDAAIIQAQISAEGSGEAAGLPGAHRPMTTGQLADLYLAHPEATLIAGATDVGLWVTKGLRELPAPIFLNAIPDLQRIERLGDRLRIGAGVTVAALRAATRDSHPGLSRMLDRFASDQVRQAATVGGNIANGSPIGDLPPALIALEARLHLRRGDLRREIALEDFFLEYRKQDRHPSEFVEAVTIPATAPSLKVWKVSRRAEQDISSVLGAFDLRFSGDVVSHARIAFGGMAGIPKRARVTEAALLGQSWDQARDKALAALAQDFQPLSDLRASAAYRLGAAQALLERYFLERIGVRTDLAEVGQW